MSRKHADHNWSAAKSWLGCDLYYQHKKQAEDLGLEWSKDSAASVRGTVMHDVSEHAVMRLTHNGRHSGFARVEIEAAIEEGLEHVPGADDLKRSDIEHIQVAVTEVLETLERAARQDSTAVCIAELAIELPHEPGSDGYVDVVIYNNTDLWIIDYKYGITPVAPESPQLTGYAVSVIDYLVCVEAHPGFERVHRGIAQPAVQHEIAWAPPISQGDLVSWMHHVIQVVEHQKRGENLRPAAELSVCDWCPAARLELCSHHKKLLVSITDGLMGGARADDPEWVELVVRNEKQIQDAIKRLKQRVIDEEETFPDWKRIQVRNPARWNPALEEEVLLTTFSEAGVDPFVLGTPASVRKSNPGHEALIDSVCAEQTHHTRLKYEPQNGETK